MTTSPPRGRRRPGELLALGIVTMGGSGLAPRAPGTAGTLAAALLLVPWMLSGPPPLWLRLSLAGLATGASVALSPWSQRHFGRSDPGAHVVDEAAGFYLATCLVPAPTPWLLLLVLVVFRVLDILKPPPIRALERAGVWLGITLDDLAAGLLAGLCGLGVALLTRG